MSSGEPRVSIPHNARKLIQQVTKTISHNHTDAFVYSTLIDSAMDPAEATRRLKMIHDIREIAGKHSVEDVYTMLKECNLDANEAAQRLLYIDTFHVVKKKHDRRKTMSSDASQENKQTRGNQWRGDKGGRGTFYTSKVFEDGGGRNLSSGKEYGATNRVEKVLKPAVPGHMGKENNIVHLSNSCANVNGTPALSNGNYNYKLASEPPADITSPTSDHVVVSSQNNKHMCPVGTIKCEIVKRSGSNESNARIPAGKILSADQSGTGTISVITEAADSDRKPAVAKKNQISDSTQPLLSSTQNSAHVVNPIQDNQQLPQSLNESLKDSVPEEESELTVTAPKVDVMLEKSTLSSHQPVIFPDHIQVPEKYKSHFVFGTLDVTPDDRKPISVTETTQQNEVVKEPSLSNGNALTIAHEGEVQDHVSEDVSCLEDNMTPDSSAPTHEQEKVEIVPTLPSTGFQNIPVLQTTRDYYGYMPSLMGPHFVKLDVPELQNGHSQAVSSVGQSPVTQPAIASQSTLALSPPLFPYFRPYPNYIPYNLYFPHMYLPPNALLLTHGVFPQPSPPPTAANVHHMAATAGMTIPTPSQNKQGSNEDSTADETKDNNILSTVQQVEDTHARAQAPLDLPNILPNYFYGFPHGQHMAAFSPLQDAALCHSSQAMTAQSTIQPPFMYQPPPTGVMVEHLQHQHAPQINRNDTALVNAGTG